jgi:ferredoxin
LVRSGLTLQVPASASATDVLAAAGIGVPTKCSDGLCGVCATVYDASASDEVEHRDVVLSQAERARRVILCCSRSVKAGGRLVVDL